MSEKLSLAAVIAAVLLSAAVILFTRVIPFILFNKKEPPVFIKFIEKYAAVLIMTVLVVYCFKDVKITCLTDSIAFYVACASVVLFHIFFKNSMISIFGSTVIFMILSRLM